MSVLEFLPRADHSVSIREGARVEVRHPLGKGPSAKGTVRYMTAAGVVGVLLDGTHQEIQVGTDWIGGEG